MSAPEVSVIMAAHNGQRYLRESIESVLEQTFNDFEFIIVDDGSIDDTWKILNEFAADDHRVISLQNDVNLGTTISLNKGLSLARGRFIARQDADDISFSERLAHQVAYLEEHGEVGLLGTAYHVIDSTGEHLATYRQPDNDTEIRWQMLFHNAFCHTSVMFRRNLLEGGDLYYNETLPFSQDYDLWSRMLQRTSAHNFASPLVAWRKSEETISTARREEQQRIATTVSARQINRLIPEAPASLHEVGTLRNWYYRLPKPLEERDLSLCLKLVHILEAFSKQPMVDTEDTRRIFKDWAHRMLAGIPIKQYGCIQTLRLLGEMFHMDATAVMAYFPKKTIRHLGSFVRKDHPDGYVR